MQTSGLALTTLVAVDIASPHSTYESVGTNARVAVQDLDRDTAKELGVKGKHKVARVPGVVLLDTYLPRKNGFEVLEEMKKEPRLQSLPIIMLTMSQREEDVIRAYANGACSFIHKSVGLDQFRERLKHFEHYWTSVSRVPVVRE